MQSIESWEHMVLQSCFPKMGVVRSIESWEHMVLQSYNELLSARKSGEGIEKAEYYLRIYVYELNKARKRLALAEAEASAIHARISKEMENDK